MRTWCPDCSPRVQSWTHIALLIAASALALFVVPGQYLKPTGAEDPIGKILLLLGVTVGLPYFCLATTGPLIQYWFTQVCPGRSAFRLYALSNLGSFLALLSFPYLFEPFFELTQLGNFWTLGFWIFVLLCATVTVRVKRLSHTLPIHVSPHHDQAVGVFSPPSLIQRLSWVLLPALASLAFIATTDHVSHDIAPEPKLWIATLGLYLLTFIVCFDHPRWYQRRWVALACLLAVVLLSGRSEIPGWFGLDLDLGVSEVRWIHLTVMFLIAFMSHGELYRLRPHNPKHLTEFYLWMSFGGACGGLFVALVATNFFTDYYEWTLCLLAAIGLAGVILGHEAARSGEAEGEVGGVAGGSQRAGKNRSSAVAAALGILLFGGLVFFWEDPFHLRSDSDDEYTDVRMYQARNFYGTISVGERRYRDDPSRDFRVFYSGRVTHGMQFLDPSKRRLATTYYSPESGVGETLEYAKSKKPSLRVAIIGLGAGTLANYARAEDHYDFYEINPQAVRVANQWFDNVPQCLARTKQIIIGDARLKLEQLPEDVLYDVIALDAFSGGSVPIHLLTREAFEIYKRHLKPDGFIAIHITNAYLNLYPVVRRQAEHLGFGFRNKYQTNIPERRIRHNQYFVMTNDGEYLQRYPSVNRQHFDQRGALIRTEDPNLPGVPLWTDHFSSLNSIEIRD
jgi:spermidine synthase